MRGVRLLVGTAVLVAAYGTMATAAPGAPGAPGVPGAPGGPAACAPDSVSVIPAPPATPAGIASLKADIAAKRLTADCLQAALTAAGDRLHSVQRDSDLAVERYDVAAAGAAQADAAASASLAAYAAAQAARDTAQENLGRFAAQAYRQGPDLLWATTLLQARTPEEFAIARYAFKNAVTSQARAVTQATDAIAAADKARQTAVAAAAAQQTAEQNAAAARDQAQQAVADAQGQAKALQDRQDALLADLAAAQGVELDLERQRQQALADAASAGGAHDPGGLPVSGPVPAQPRARAILAYIEAQLGKPYVWGAAGPDAFDCSGLVMRGLQAAGLTYPHPAQWQYLAMHPVAYSQLQPGDLVFWATDPANPHTIYHEAAYLGNDRVIQAPHPGGVVDIASLWQNGVPSFYARP